MESRYNAALAGLFFAGIGGALLFHGRTATAADASAIPFTFGMGLDFAVIIKNYNALPEVQTRYSPPEVVAVTTIVQTGSPDESQICTSHVERSNLTLRMQIRRLTRLTNAHSKKWENHEAALALFFAYYNFCRVHSTIGCTPAVKSGLAKETWSVKRLIEEVNKLL